MKTTNILIKFDAPRAAALSFYMEKKGASIEDELAKVIDLLYEKNVPKDARELIEWQSVAALEKPKRTLSSSGKETARQCDSSS